MFASILVLVLSLFSGAAVEPSDALTQCATETSVNCFWDAAESGNGQGVDFVDVDGVALYACETEDAANCFWDASKAGNGHGASFTDVDGVAYYWPTVGA